MKIIPTWINIISILHMCLILKYNWIAFYMQWALYTVLTQTEKAMQKKNELRSPLANSNSHQQTNVTYSNQLYCHIWSWAFAQHKYLLNATNIQVYLGI